VKYIRAVRPLNSDAVAAANAAVREQTGGRPLTNSPADAALRKKWMTAYQNAGGKIEVVDTDDPPVKPTKPTQECPVKCKPILSIELVSVEFTSDHALLKNQTGDWTNTGNLYPKPHWVNGRATQSPISHSMDHPVKARVKVRVKPKNACVESGSLRGHGPDGLAFTMRGISYGPGEPVFEVSSKGKLPIGVQQMDLDIDWTFQAKSTTGSGTSQNTCFVTIDTPVNEGKPEDGVTFRRMSAAVQRVGDSGSIDPHEIVASLMGLLPYYTLQRSPSVPAEFKHPTYFNSVGGAWPIQDYLTYYAECQAIVRFVRGILKQVGCPGEAKPVVVWADPDVSGGATALEQELEKGGGLNGKRKKVGSKTWYAALADRDPVAVGRVFTPANMGMNNFEACLRFTHGGVTKYYGGGAGAFDSPQEVIKAFQALVWLSVEYDSSGNANYRIEEIVQRYR
jgi:hypothetical protein